MRLKNNWRLNSHSFKPTYKFWAIATCSVWVLGCSPSKVSQCNELIQVANQAVTEVQSVISTARPDDRTALNKIADAADKATTGMKALELQDQQLQAYRDRFVTMYTNTGKASRDLVAAGSDRQATEQAFKALQDATNQEAPLVDEVNTYCRQNQ